MFGSEDDDDDDDYYDYDDCIMAAVESGSHWMRRKWDELIIHLDVSLNN